MKFINFSIFVVFFALLDPDPFRIRIHNTVKKLPKVTVYYADGSFFWRGRDVGELLCMPDMRGTV
jgi:hypothetical protein